VDRLFQRAECVLRRGRRQPMTDQRHR
jgi:hypothetical protein